MIFSKHRTVLGFIAVLAILLIIGVSWLMTGNRTQLEVQRQQHQPELAAAIARFALVTGSPEGIKKEVLRTVATDSHTDLVLTMDTSGWWITFDYEIIAMDIRQYTESTAEVWVRETSRTMTYDTVANQTRGRPMCDESSGIYQLKREGTTWNVDFVDLTSENRGQVIPDFCEPGTD